MSDQPYSAGLCLTPKQERWELKGVIHIALPSHWPLRLPGAQRAESTWGQEQKVITENIGSLLDSPYWKWMAQFKLEREVVRLSEEISF